MNCRRCLPVIDNRTRKLESQTWSSLRTLRKLEDLHKICSPESIPRLAKDEIYAKDILKAWNEDYEERGVVEEVTAPPAAAVVEQQEGDHVGKDIGGDDTKSDGTKSSSSSISDGYTKKSTRSRSRRKQIDSYGCEFPYMREDGVELSGYLVIPSYLHESNFDISHKVPVIIMFHTGAGPQDIFNRFQADKLARESIWDQDNGQGKGGRGCIVFIADIVSDSIGWTWGDRDRYWRSRKELMKVTEDSNGTKQRFKLQETLSATMDAVNSIDFADINKVAAIGFCLGGQPILELGRMQYDGILGLITFHGLFDGYELSDRNGEQQKTSTWKDKPREVLICNGADDSYVPESDLLGVTEVFQGLGWYTKVINFENTYHNFSNPRTTYDDPDSPFGYNKDAATNSWNATISLLQHIFEL